MPKDPLLPPPLLAPRAPSGPRDASEESSLWSRTEFLDLAERSAGIGIWDVDLATGLARGRPQFFRIMGLEPVSHPVPIETFRALRHPEDRARVVDGFHRALESGADHYEMEYRIRRPDGETRWIFGRGRVMRDAGGKPVRYSGVDIDITERKAAEAALAASEERLRLLNADLERRVAERTVALEAEAARRAQAEARLHQAQKMEALGQLTGGLAHDFNNVLLAIANNLQVARRSGDSMKQREHIDFALDAVDSGAKMIKQLLIFARKQPLNVHSIEINAVIEGMTALLRRTCPEVIELKFELGAEAGWVRADPYQLQTVLLNLIVNARDAMPHGGAITIGTGVATHQPGGPNPAPADTYTCVSIVDSGIGMAPEVLRQAFEPFFTTKDIGKGTGLGLSMVLGAMRQIGGDAVLESASGRGTTVRLYFPRARPSKSEEAERPRATEAVPRVTLAAPLLFVEDDLLINLSTAELLEDAGYTVHAATRADEALKILDKHPEINLLVTDVGLPQVSGHALAEEARRRRPGIKVLFVTGYDRTGGGESFVRDVGVAYVAKPYQPEELYSAIERLRTPNLP